PAARSGWRERPSSPGRSPRGCWSPPPRPPRRGCWSPPRPCFCPPRCSAACPPHSCSQRSNDMTDSAPADGSIELPPAIELRRVSKHYGIGKDQQVAAADDVSLTVEAGAFVALTAAPGPATPPPLPLTHPLSRPHPTP